MAKEKPSPRLSFHPDDATVGEGLFGAGPAKALKHIFGYFKYPKGNMAGKKVTALLVTFERDGEKHVEAMTVGKGFKPTDDGRSLVPPEGVAGLPSGCKMMQYMRSVVEEGEATKEVITESATDIGVLNGLEGALIRKPMEKSEGMTGNPTVLVWDTIAETPWGTENGAARKKKAKKVEEEDDEEEAPKKTAKKAKDDDEDDVPDDVFVDEDAEELATEGLIEALEDGPLRLSKVEAAVAATLKGQKGAKEAAALAATPKFLKKENGWEFGGKIVSLDK